MKYNYQNIAISKDFYKSGEGFSKCLERLDPSEQYRGTELAGYDALWKAVGNGDLFHHRALFYSAVSCLLYTLPLLFVKTRLGIFLFYPLQICPL